MFRSVFPAAGYPVCGLAADGFDERDACFFVGVALVAAGADVGSVVLRLLGRGEDAKVTTVRKLIVTTRCA